MWYLEAKKDFKKLHTFGPYATKEDANAARSKLLKTQPKGVVLTLPLKKR